MSVFELDTLCRYFAIVEQSIDVNSFQVDQIHLWPFLRLTLASILRNDVNEELYIQRASDPNWQKTVELIQTAFDSLQLSTPNPAPLKLEETSPGSKNGLEKTSLIGFVSRPADHNINTSDGWYSSIIDGWYHLAKRNCQTQKMEFMVGETRDPTSFYPRVHPPYLIYPPFYSSDTSLLQEFNNQSKLIVQSVADFSREKLGLSFGGDGLIQQLDILIKSSLGFRNSMLSILKRLPFDLVMIGVSHYAIGFGVHWAASDLGIDSVELQHGGFGQATPVYTHQTSLPETGYRVRPKIYCAWGQKTADFILKWYPRNHNYHKVIVGGKVSNDHLTDFFEKEIQLLKEIIPTDQKVILVSLDSNHNANSIETKTIRNLVLSSPKNWFWLIRQHYMANTLGFEGGLVVESINHLFNSLHFSRFEAELSSSLPLNLVLSLCDHHVTNFSSTVLEALANGLQTTFLHKYAKIQFEYLSHNGLAHFPSTVEEAIYSISQSSKSKEVLELGQKEVDFRYSTHDNFFRSTL